MDKPSKIKVLARPNAAFSIALNPRSKHKRTCSLTENVCPSKILRPRTIDRRAVRKLVTKPRKTGTRTTRKACNFSAVLQHPSLYTKLFLPAQHVGVWWGYDIPTTRSLTMVLARSLSRHGKGLVAPMTGGGDMIFQPRAH